MIEEIVIDEDDRFVYCQKDIDGCVIRYTKDKIFPEEKHPNNIHEMIIKSYKRLKDQEEK